MRVVSIITEVGTSAEIYHVLRQDRSFDLFCAHDDQAEYILHTETDEISPEGEVIVTVESSLNYGKKKLPIAVSVALGGKGKEITVTTKMRFYEMLFDAEHLCNVETRPSMLGGRTRIFGQSWVEPVSETSCRLHSDLSIDVGLPGVGVIIESMVANRVSKGLNRLNKLMIRYMQTPECKEFLAGVFNNKESGIRQQDLPTQTPEPKTPESRASRHLFAVEDDFEVDDMDVSTYQSGPATPAGVRSIHFDEAELSNALDRAFGSPSDPADPADPEAHTESPLQLGGGVLGSPALSPQRKQRLGKFLPGLGQGKWKPTRSEC